jgi:hypothetical protein
MKKQICDFLLWIRTLRRFFVAMNRQFKISALFLLGLLLACFLAIPVNAADKILFSYGPEILSLKVSSLELYAQSGIINQDLEFYLSFAAPEAQKSFREALTQKISLDPDQVTRFFHTKIGETILSRLGEVVTLQGGVNGKYALRSAIEAAALSPDGLTLLNVIKQFPTNRLLIVP